MTALKNRLFKMGPKSKFVKFIKTCYYYFTPDGLLYRIDDSKEPLSRITPYKGLEKEILTNTFSFYASEEVLVETLLTHSNAEVRALIRKSLNV